jgi:UDP-D-galactose:(glucosyl)LPS alpha-1,3-D-galactosyltransferase
MTALAASTALVCGIDDGYARALRAVIRSIGAAHGPATSQLRLIVLGQGLAPANKAAISAEATAANLPVSVRPAPTPDPDYPVSDWVSSAVYTRLSIPEVIDDEERVLYLDADTLVLGDLRPLLELRLDGHCLAAALDPQNPLTGRGIAMPGWCELGIDYGRPYFNSGVMLIDLPAAQRAGLFTTARRFLAEHPDKVRFWDQDALNYAADGRWLRLEPCWNTFALSPLASRPGFVHHAEADVPLAGLLADEQTAAILHYAGPDKPWQPSYPPGRLRELYRRFQVADHDGEA